MSQEIFFVGSEATRQRAIRSLTAAPIFDRNTRQLIVILKRAVSDYGRSKKRRFHAYVNILAELRDVPAPAMKWALKARLCPLVEVVNPITGEISWTAASSRDWSDEQANEACEKAVKFAVEEWGIHLPVSDLEWDQLKADGVASIRVDPT